MKWIHYAPFVKKIKIIFYVLVVLACKLFSKIILQKNDFSVENEIFFKKKRENYFAKKIILKKIIFKHEWFFLSKKGNKKKNMSSFQVECFFNHNLYYFQKSLKNILQIIFILIYNKLALYLYA